MTSWCATGRVTRRSASRCSRPSTRAATRSWWTGAGYPTPARRNTAPPADAPPTGAVTVTGWLRTGEPNLGRDLPAPQLASISLADARARVPQLSDLDLYLVLGAQGRVRPPATTRSLLLPRPTRAWARTRRYAYQWWLYDARAGLASASSAIVGSGPAGRRVRRHRARQATARCGSGTRRTPERRATSRTALGLRAAKSAPGGCRRDHSAGPARGSCAGRPTGRGAGRGSP